MRETQTPQQQRKPQNLLLLQKNHQTNYFNNNKRKNVIINENIEGSAQSSRIVSVRLTKEPTCTHWTYPRRETRARFVSESRALTNTLMATLIAKQGPTRFPPVSVKPFSLSLSAWILHTRRRLLLCGVQTQRNSIPRAAEPFFYMYIIMHHR